MPEKKNWTQQQDKVLRELFQIKKIGKWSTIAQKMANEYHMPGRNGKQCRQRYQSVLQPNFYHLSWTQQEEKLMYQLHDEVGNKWAQIAQRMPGRTDNCVKNHFYSNLRKSLRKLNMVISQKFKPHIKQIRPLVVYKIIEASDQQFKIQSKIDQEQSIKCANLKNKLLEFGRDNCPFQQDFEQIRELAQQIQNFSRNYKRKPKKDRRGVAQSMNLMKVPKIDKFKCASDIEEDSISVQSQSSIQLGQKSQHKQQIKSQSGALRVVNTVICLNDSKQQQQQKGIKLYLKNNGLPLIQGGSNSIHYSALNPLRLSMTQSSQFQKNDKYLNQNFNLGRSIDGINHSFLWKNSREIDNQNLFGSTSNS